ncbi:hypothetical protein WME98_41470 [Sorangium sp. So ce296]
MSRPPSSSVKTTSLSEARIARCCASLCRSSSVRSSSFRFASSWCARRSRVISASSVLSEG